MDDGFLPFGVVVDAVGGSSEDMQQYMRGSRDCRPQLRTDGMVGSIDSAVFLEAACDGSFGAERLERIESRCSSTCQASSRGGNWPVRAHHPKQWHAVASGIYTVPRWVRHDGTPLLAWAAVVDASGVVVVWCFKGRGEARTA